MQPDEFTPGPLPPARHVVEDHTGELEIRIEAPTLRDLFAEAGRALADAMGGAPQGPLDVEAQVSLDAPDRDALLVDWLNELVFHSEVEKAVFAEIELTAAGEDHLEATIRGTRVERLRNPVKAATFHGLRISEREGTWSGTVVLDV